MSTYDPVENDGIIEPGLLTRIRWFVGSRWFMAAILILFTSRWLISVVRWLIVR
jgi:hypothetical protein